MRTAHKAVFFDLQGTLGGDGLGDIRDFDFFPTAARAISLVNDADLLAVIITNQDHIGKGAFTMEEFQRRMAELREKLANDGAMIDAVYCCPHVTADRCDCKKPLPGMLLRAQADLGIDLGKSYVIGDAGAWDMTLAKSIGSFAVLVRTGLGMSSLHEYRHTWKDIEPDHIAEEVLEALEWVIARERICEQPHAADAGKPRR